MVSKSGYKQFIIIIDNIIQNKISENETQILYTSFIFHKENPNHKKLVEIYSQIESALNKEK